MENSLFYWFLAPSLLEAVEDKEVTQDSQPTFKLVLLQTNSNLHISRYLPEFSLVTVFLREREKIFYAYSRPTYVHCTTKPKELSVLTYTIIDFHSLNSILFTLKVLKHRVEKSSEGCSFPRQFNGNLQGYPLASQFQLLLKIESPVKSKNVFVKFLKLHGLGYYRCLATVEFLDSTVRHLLILAILLHNIVFHP